MDPTDEQVDPVCYFVLAWAREVVDETPSG
jgi:hypothetical protein